MPLMLERYAPLWLAGILGAGIMAAVMASDSQILALSTMFTEDVFAYYGGKARFGEAVQVRDRPHFRGRADRHRLSRRVARAARHLRARRPVRLLRAMPRSRRCSSRRSSGGAARSGARWRSRCGPRLQSFTRWRVPGGLAWFGLMPVVPMTLVSCALMVAVSLLTRPPSAATIARYQSRSLAVPSAKCQVPSGVESG